MGETGPAPDGNVKVVVSEGPQRLFGRCPLIARLQRATEIYKNGKKERQ